MSLKEIPASFSTKTDAQHAFTATRKRARIALRGAVVLGPDYHGTYRIHADTDGTGYSPAELARELHRNRDA